jgi:hypothetical protein
LHGADRAKADSIEEWPEPPEIYAKLGEAKDPAAILQRFAP